MTSVENLVFGIEAGESGDIKSPFESLDSTRDKFKVLDSLMQSLNKSIEQSRGDIGKIKGQDLVDLGRFQLVSLETKNHLQQSCKENIEHLKALDDLLEIRNLLSVAECSYTIGDFISCLDSFTSIEERLETFQENWGKAAVIDGLYKKLDIFKRTVYDKISQLWDQAIFYNKDTCSLLVSGEIIINHDNVAIPLVHLFDALARTDLKPIKINKLVLILENYILTPLLDLDRTVNAERDIIKTILSNEEPTLKTVVDDLRKFVNFLNDSLPRSLISTISSRLSNLIITKLRNVTLANLLPIDLNLIDNFKKELTHLDVLEDFLVEKKWVNIKELHAWSTEIPEIWVKKLHDFCLERMRTDLLNFGEFEYTKVEDYVFDASSISETDHSLRSIEEPHVSKITEAKKVADTKTITGTKLESSEEDNWDSNWNEDVDLDLDLGNDIKEEVSKDSKSEEEETEDGWGLDDELILSDDETKDEETEKISQQKSYEPEMDKADEKIDSYEETDKERREGQSDWNWGEDNDFDIDSIDVEPNSEHTSAPFNAIKTEKPVIDHSLHSSLKPGMVFSGYKTITQIHTILSSNIGYFTDELDKVAHFDFFNGTSGGVPLPLNKTTSMQYISEFYTLFRALIPFIYSANYDPLIISNDLSNLANMIKGSCLLGSVDDVESLLLSSQKYITEIIQDGRSQILESITKANNFQSCTDPDNLFKCQVAVERLMTKLTTLREQWGDDIIPIKQALSMLGLLLDCFTSRFVELVISLGDISEDESKELSRFVSILQDMSTIFSLDQNDEPQPAFYCASWLKFQYLGEILDSKLVDIRYLYESNALIDFTKQELFGLIIGLFAESENRQKLLDFIMEN